MKGPLNKTWLIFIILAVLFSAVWYRLTYPQFSILNLTVDRKEALRQAEVFLKSEGIDISGYKRAVVLEEDYWADVYLQRVLGFEEEEKFVKSNDYEIIYWVVRFFKQNQKEEFRIDVSPRSGQIVRYRHLIEDTQERPVPVKELAKSRAKDFLEKTYRINFDEYQDHEERLKRFDKRIDYEFSWERKDIYIPWQELRDSGGAKLLIRAIVSGDEIREFHKNRLDIPEKFLRFVERQLYLGRCLSSISFLLTFLWIALATVIFLKRMISPRISLCWRFYLFVGLSLTILGLFEQINNLNYILFNYPTSSTISSFMGLFFVSTITTLIFISISFIVPGIAGEYLSQEVYADKKQSYFSHYLRTSFLNRSIAKSIFFGYILAPILLGLQSIFLYLGNKFLGLWFDRIRFTEVSSVFIPFFSAFFLAAIASFREEIIYRLFGISWSKRYLRNTVVAILLTSIIWGFGHSEYPVFPIWFRALEVSLLGVVYGIVFLKYGIIPLIISHYLFDVFWISFAYIFGNSKIHFFLGSIFILSIPLIYAIIAYLLDLPEKEKKEMALSSQQLYSIQILITYINKRVQEGASLQELEKELLLHGWDETLVRMALTQR